MSNKKMNFNPGALNTKVSDTIQEMEAKDSFNFRNISLDLIDHSDKNDYELTAIEELAENIKLIGLQQNLVVRPKDNGRFELLTGHRRYEALKHLGETKAPCKVETSLEGQNNDLMAEYTLHSTNQQVRKEDDMSKARHVRRMKELLKEMKANGQTIKGRIDEIVGKDMGISSMQVQRLDKLNDLIPELQEMVTNKEITMSKATHFAGMKEEDQRAILELLKENVNLTREEAQKLKLQLKQKDEEVKNTVESINKKFEEEISTLKYENRELNETNRALQDEIENKNSEITEFDKKIKSISQKIKEEAEKEASSKSKGKIEELISERNRILKDKADTEAKLKELNTKIESKSKQEKDNILLIERNLEIKVASSELNKAITLFNATMAKNDKIDISDENKKSFEFLRKQVDVISKYLEIK
jgi:ParB family chromosome partitioning protein